MGDRSLEVGRKGFGGWGHGMWGFGVGVSSGGCRVESGGSLTAAGGPSLRGAAYVAVSGGEFILQNVSNKSTPPQIANSLFTILIKTIS